VETLIEFQGAAIGYSREAPLIPRLTMSLKKGDHTMIVGHCGVGKSALVKTIMGILSLWDGTYQAFERGMENPSEPLLSYVRKKIGLLPDRGILLQNMTVFQNIALPLRFGHFFSIDKVRDRIEPYIEEFSLEPLLELYPCDLNIDQIKKIGFVRAILNDPDLLLLDDPYEGLDDEGFEKMNRSLKNIAEKGATTILALSRKSVDRSPHFKNVLRLTQDGLTEIR